MDLNHFFDNLIRIPQKDYKKNNNNNKNCTEVKMRKNVPPHFLFFPRHRKAERGF